MKHWRTGSRSEKEEEDPRGVIWCHHQYIPGESVISKPFSKHFCLFINCCEPFYLFKSNHNKSKILTGMWKEKSPHPVSGTWYMLTKWQLSSLLVFKPKNPERNVRGTQVFVVLNLWPNTLSWNWKSSHPHIKKPPIHKISCDPQGLSLLGGQLARKS